MNRGRRLASILVVASLGLGSLAGCQTETGKAAFVGDTTISEDRVSEVFDDAVAKTPKQEPAPEASASPAPAAELPVTRQEVVDLLVSLELARRVVKEKNMPPAKEPTEPAEIAQALAVAGDSEYVKLWAEWLDLQTVITENTPRAQLTDAGIMKVYDALAKTGAIQAGLPVEQVREQFGAAIFAEAAILVSTSLGAEAEATDTKVNPKYDPVSAPMAVGTQQGPVFYNLPYITSDLVTDVSL
ncbi:hypothetical protein RB614_29605 [Phytohabitans sp. ZYX-F-186]|uniref:Lipoprotein n=1 Tax=Phytohabitans maris TaxID=3071409 RepID=A0ABU0ZNT1_9ACTN|nr:hypothetical protein [Phytohabitans sp. ZYX-F-186]MDQ7908697.1 hypothetical protein [Phytohabitans sp. ZYX-F-186]